MLGLLWMLAALAPPPATEAAERTGKARVLTRVVRAVGACDDLTASDLAVQVRGRPVTDPSRYGIGPRPRRSLHALLLDTSASMDGRLDAIRRTVLRYLEEIPADDPALVASFDETVVLHQPATRDRAALEDALSGVHVGGYTSLYDGVVFVLQELAAHPERPVLLLLTDGVDSTTAPSGTGELNGSIYERHDLFERIAAMPELTVFTVGLALPPLSSSGPAGLSSTRSFLQRIAEETNGEFYEASVSSQLDGIYRDVRERLASEHEVWVADPDPYAETTEVRVRSTDPRCRIETFRSPDTRRPVASVWAPFLNDAHHRTSGECETVTPLARRGDVLAACVLDLTTEPGILHDPSRTSGWQENGWPMLTTRSLEIRVPPFTELPRGTEGLLDRLARRILPLDPDVARDARMRPAGAHARPYADIPALAHGRTLFDLRGAVAAELATAEGYRDLAPGRLAHVDSVLAGWLGDRPAHALFAQWEAEEIVRAARGVADPTFPARYAALEQVFRAASYARVLTVLEVVRAEDGSRVGFYRILLPRVSWVLPRVRAEPRPLDWIPERPLAYLAALARMDRDPAIRRGLATESVGAPRYRSDVKPRKQTRRGAFARATVEIPVGDALVTLEVADP